jgi:predicted RNase H-like nuclease
MEPTFTTIIGIDCATTPVNVGMARARLMARTWLVTDTLVGGGDRDPATQVARWLEEDEHVLLALDAPLGWPRAMVPALTDHRAGTPVAAPAETLFNRETDRMVRRSYRKRPLEVGADRIARTAYAALMLLDDVRRATGKDVPLAWTPRAPVPAAIEVYPAATLAVHRVSVSGYKKADATEARAVLSSWLAGTLKLPYDLDATRLSEHALDAMVCVVAGVDFVTGCAVPPQDRGLAEAEGWIWVRSGADP